MTHEPGAGDSVTAPAPRSGDPGPTRTRTSPGQWVVRMLDLALVVVIVAVLFDPRSYDPRTQALASLQWSGLWLLLGVVYIVIRARRARRARRGDARWPDRLGGRIIGYLIIVSTAVSVLTAGLSIATRPLLIEFAAGLPDPAAGARLTRLVNVAVVISFPTVFVAWVILHLAYAERYARLWLHAGRDADPPITFPGTPAPTLLEFVYFSFTVGVSVATSDCTIRSDRLRGVVIRHAVLSFVYGTVILGIVIGIVGG